MISSGSAVLCLQFSSVTFMNSTPCLSRTSSTPEYLRNHSSLLLRSPRFFEPNPSFLRASSHLAQP